LHTASEDIGLINRIIKFHLAQHMWSASINVTDGRTDGRHTTATPFHAMARDGKKARQFYTSKQIDTSGVQRMIAYSL